MRFSTIVAALLVPAAAFAAEIVVKVGNGGTLAFDPPSVTAQNGDTIAFQLWVCCVRDVRADANMRLHDQPRKEPHRYSIHVRCSLHEHQR